MTNHIYEEIHQQIEDNTLVLARLPETICEVNAALADDDKGLADIAKVIQHDVALSSRIIRIVNSPLLRNSSPILSVFDAINRLGVDFVKNLAFCVSIRDKFNSKNVTHRHLMEQILHESEQQSFVSYFVTKYLTDSKLVPETSLLCGLVSRIGHMVILRYVDDHPQYKTLDPNEIDGLMYEYGETITEHILERWNFPTIIINAMSEQHMADINNPSTYRDVYMLTCKYLEYKDGTGENYKVFERVDAVLEACQGELATLKSSFT